MYQYRCNRAPNSCAVVQYSIHIKQQLSYHMGVLIYLQKMHMGAHLEGGCPFSSCDVSHLKQLMNLEGIQIAQTAILDLVSLERCSEACHVFLAEKIKVCSQMTI